MKRKSKRVRKIRNLVIVCALWASFLMVSTYAWFVGMKTVNVAKFEIKIATTEGLFLSMDGEHWSYTLDAKTEAAYVGNTNYWADGENEGLIPMSTVGDMDSSVSRMILFEKGSLTTTNGGYRLLASRVDNYVTPEGETAVNQGKGYVVFDLFVKNLSGAAYYEENNVQNEEAIYLTTNSKVKVSDRGGEAGTGIENSVRVAFTQIGRVIGTEEDESVITGITCSDVAAAEEGHLQVTGICRDAQIWEPNDTTHVQNAINWYNASCRLKNADSSYSTVANTCNSVSQTTNTEDEDDSTVTYAISRVIDVDDHVDIYDGKRYNKFEGNTADYATYKAALKNVEGAPLTGEDLTEAKADYKLVQFPYFTDTAKVKTGTNRPTFMTLAPNSITKLRVYVYIEGQDVDNYDFASLGKQITVNFGFTKERYNPEDINYEGPAHPVTVSE